LYITPLYEQIRRFSTNYVRSFIDQSPIKHLWLGTHTENSVLQRTFSNNSKMIFSFAYLDADRTRGVSSDFVSFDESVRGDNTCVLTERGQLPILQVKPGDVILSFDRQRRITRDIVTKRNYHGRRTCWRFRLASGDFVDMTSESWLVTNQGWKRAS